MIDTPEWKSSPNSPSSNMVKSSVYIFGGGNRENDVTGDTHLILEMQLKNENPSYMSMAAADAATYPATPTSN